LSCWKANFWDASKLTKMLRSNAFDYDDIAASGCRRSLARAWTLKRSISAEAVSTAYYAVFHCLAKTCASTLTFREGTEEYARIYRALDHGPLKTAFSSGPLKDRQVLREVGNIVILLQSERHKADYLPPTRGVFTTRQAQKLVDQARDVISKIEGLGTNDRQTLAAYLLFKNRPS